MFKCATQKEIESHWYPCLFYSKKNHCSSSMEKLRTPSQHRVMVFPCKGNVDSSPLRPQPCTLYPKRSGKKENQLFVLSSSTSTEKIPLKLNPAFEINILREKKELIWCYWRWQQDWQPISHSFL